MSVHCGYCYKRGHNKLGCPERKSDAKARPDSYLAREVAREQAEFKLRAKRRSCSYCGESGHNRRGCQQKKNDIRQSEELSFLYRKKLAKVFQKEGIQLGSLIEVPYYKEGYSDQEDIVGKFVHIIERINWENTSHRLAGPALGGVYPRNWRLDNTGMDNNIIQTRLLSWEFNCPTEELKDRDYWLSETLKPMKRSNISITSFLNEEMTPSLFDPEEQAKGASDSQAEKYLEEPHVWSAQNYRVVPVREMERYRSRVLAKGKDFTNYESLPKTLSMSFRFDTNIEAEAGWLNYGDEQIQENISKLKEEINC